MTFFSALNILLSAAIAVLVIYKMGWLQSRLITMEMVGLGFLGAGVVLNIAPILNSGSPFPMVIDTPYDDWGSTLLRLGMFTYLYGRTSRQWRHDADNARHAEELEQDIAELRELKINGNGVRK